MNLNLILNFGVQTDVRLLHVSVSSRILVPRLYTARDRS